MLVSARWLNDYLDPPATPEEQADLLTRAGFPLEGTDVLPDGDVRQDFEMTSNRGDCVCHVGLAREIAAMSGRTLKLPPVTLNPGGPPAAGIAKVVNHEPALCPLYTARIIRGVTVRPSPPWLQERLIARGDIPRNNIVDVTNYILFGLGQPTHVFDLDTLAGSEINIRPARPDEPFLPIGEGAEEVRLSPQDLVIADRDVAVAIAGVKGGAISAVTERTTDILLEAATFDPVAVRNTSRRLGIGSDSSYRFERGVHPGQVNSIADRLAQLILELGGGELCDGVVQDGAPIPAPRTASMRTERCRQLLGVPLEDARMVEALDRLGFAPTAENGRIVCTVPVQRLDIEREIDLIEEVSRVYGHDNFPIADALHIHVAPTQASQTARQVVCNELAGLGFVQAVTHSLVSEPAAASFQPPGTRPLRVDDERARAAPVLRPSLLSSLLRVRGLNLRNGIEHLRLFEMAATYCRAGDDGHDEQVKLALLADLEDATDGLRPLRGVVERVVELLKGAGTAAQVTADPSIGWMEPGAVVTVNGEPIGQIGCIAPALLAGFDLDRPVLAAELLWTPLLAGYPPQTLAHGLPAFPAIERDVSAIVDESLAWSEIEQLIGSLNLDDLEAIVFVTAYRGRQIDAGRKSVTCRLRFRAPDRTLTHEGVDPQMEQVMAAMSKRLGAEIRKASG